MAYESLVSHLLKNSEHKNLKVMVKDISKLLGMSEASIYNKFNGRSRFSIEELFTICQKSNISLDHLIHAQEPKNSYVPFYADGLMYQPRNYPDYFQNVISYFAKVKMHCHPINWTIIQWRKFA